MNQILGIDHVAITVKDLEESCTFYNELFGARVVLNYAPNGRPLVRQVTIGGALLSIHQVGNGIELVAKSPTVGASDVCFRWGGSIDSAINLLRVREIAIIEGPAPRHFADGSTSQSIYFRDPDGNLLELMAAE